MFWIHPNLSSVFWLLGLSLKVVILFTAMATDSKVVINVSNFYVLYLNSEADTAQLHETVDLVQSQPVVVVACR